MRSLPLLYPFLVSPVAGVKDDGGTDLAAAIRAVGGGQRYLSSRLAKSASDRGMVELSKRERSVLALIGDGLSNRQIAIRLSLSVNTIETHRRHIIEKLNLHTTAALVRYALRHPVDE